MGKKNNFGMNEKQLASMLQNVDMQALTQAAEQDKFKQYLTLGIINKYAMLTSQDGAFVPLSKADAQNTQNCIIYDDSQESENGYPIVTEVDEEDGHVIAKKDADESYGNKAMHFRVMQEDNDNFILVFCDGVEGCLIILDGQWFTA